MDESGFVSVDESKIPKILFSRKNTQRYMALLNKNEWELSDGDKAFMREMDNAIIENFTKNYGYTKIEAEKYVLELRKKLSG